MATPRFQLHELVSLYRQMQSCFWENNRLCGALTVTNQDTAAFLGRLLAEDCASDYPCNVKHGDPDNVTVGSSFSLEFGPIRSGLGLVVPDVQTLLRHSDLAAGTADVPWYVQSLDLASWEEGKDVCSRLIAVRRLVKALEEIAALFDHRKPTLIFLRDGRFDVPVHYRESDLMQIDKSAVERLIRDLELNDGHSAQRREICVTALCELLAGVPIEARFSKLLQNMGELHQRFIDGYTLFASSFSYETVRDQAEAIRLEYTGKIHKSLSDIQGQLLGIPISTIVVATQFKSVTTDPGQLWINIAVLAGALFFCILLLFSLWNQYQTLHVIDQEVIRHEVSLKKDNAGIAARLGDVFSTLRGRITLHFYALIAVGLIAAVGLMIAFAVFLNLSRGAL